MNTTTIYASAFNKLLRNTYSHEDISTLNSFKPNGESYVAPSEFLKAFEQKIKDENLFRKYSTILISSCSEGKIFTDSVDADAVFVSEEVPYPKSDAAFNVTAYSAHKLAMLTKMKNTLINDLTFDLSDFLSGVFSKRFGRAEEKAFISGTGIHEPTGILNTAEVGITADTADVLTYDDMIKLFLSSAPEYRKNGVWLMNDETMLHLRTLKDSNGNYLWNGNTDTILGKPVETTPYMPNIGSGTIPVAFGDLSYYWVIVKQNISLKVFTELFADKDMTGYAAYERIDGKLIKPEAVKVLKMKTTA